MSRLQSAIDQIIFARNYTLRLLDETPADIWFQPPPGGVSHIAWQVGHLAYAQYRLALWRIRGARPTDDELISQEFVRLFGPKSSPSVDKAVYPSPEGIRSVFDGVHALAVTESSKLTEAELDDAVAHPHPFATTKLRALQWCASHELVHAGQIGLLRRQLGCSPLW